jgi:hypothetical protein
VTDQDLSETLARASASLLSKRDIELFASQQTILDKERAQKHSS